jgi:hypothetical protein
MFGVDTNLVRGVMRRRFAMLVISGRNNNNQTTRLLPLHWRIRRPTSYVMDRVYSN